MHHLLVTLVMGNVVLGINANMTTTLCESRYVGSGFLKDDSVESSPYFYFQEFERERRLLQRKVRKEAAGN